MDDNNTILKDLGELVENTKSAVKAKFSYEDVSLSGGFKKAFAKNIASGGNTIEYLKSTAIITTSAGLKIYLPNQWCSCNLSGRIDKGNHKVPKLH